MTSEFKNTMTRQQAAQNIFMLMRRNFDENIQTILSGIHYLDVVKAEEELVLLDLFAAYYSLNNTVCNKWRDNANDIFYSIKSLFVRWIEGIYVEKDMGTSEDVENIIDTRLKSYMACIENIEHDNCEGMKRLVGETYALYTIMGDNFIGSDGRPIGQMYLNLKSLIGPDIDDNIINIGADSFWRRVLLLFEIFKTNDLKQ